MRRIAYKDVFRKLEALWTGAHDDTPTVDAGVANVHLNTWAARFWEKYFWPEWTAPEERSFRAPWSGGTTYGAPTATVPVEVYHVRSGHYYQSIQAVNLNHEPEDSAGTVASTWWAASASSYSGNDWTASTVYTVATVVRNPADNRFYQCFTAHTSGASFDTTKFGILTPFLRSIDYAQAWEPTVIGDVRKIYDVNPRIYFGAANEREFILGDKIYVTGNESTVWVDIRLRPPSFTGNAHVVGTTYVAGDQVYYDTTGDYYVNIVTTASALPTDTTKWTRIDFPWVLRDCVSQAAVSAMLRLDDDIDRANIEMGLAQQSAADEYTRISRSQGQATRLPYKKP